MKLVCLLCLLSYTNIAYSQTNLTAAKSGLPARLNYEALVDSAKKLESTHVLYSVDENRGIKAGVKTTYDPIFMNNFIFYINYATDDNTDPQRRYFVRTREHKDVRLDPGSVIHSFGNHIIYELAKPYIPGQPYIKDVIKLTISGGGVPQKSEPYDTSELKSSPYNYWLNKIIPFDDRKPIITPVINESRRLRGRLVLFTVPPSYDNLDEYGYHLYYFGDTGLRLLASADLPINLHVPGLKGYKEAFLINNILYEQDIEQGTYKFLGYPDAYHHRYEIPNEPFSFQTIAGMYEYDPVRNVLLGDRVFSKSGADTIDLSNFNYTYVWSRTESDIVYVYNDSGEMIPIVEIEGYDRQVFSVQKEGSKIYLSLNNLALVYDIEKKEVLESYTTPPGLDTTEFPYERINWAIYCLPFGGRTYVYATIDPVYRNNQR